MKIHEWWHILSITTIFVGSSQFKCSLLIRICWIFFGFGWAEIFTLEQRFENKRRAFITFVNIASASQHVYTTKKKRDNFTFLCSNRSLFYKPNKLMKLGEHFCLDSWLGNLCLFYLSYSRQLMTLSIVEKYYFSNRKNIVADMKLSETSKSNNSLQPGQWAINYLIKNSTQRTSPGSEKNL